jgi:hypothetical protein
VKGSGRDLFRFVDAHSEPAFLTRWIRSSGDELYQYYNSNGAFDSSWNPEDGSCTYCGEIAALLGINTRTGLREHESVCFDKGGEDGS